MKMKIYISGPMTGIEGYNASEFYKAEKTLRDNGFDAVNPFNVGETVCITEDHTIKEKYDLFMKADITALMDCESIFMLNGHEKSKGAKMELSIAKFFNMEIYDSKSIGVTNGSS